MVETMETFQKIKELVVVPERQSVTLSVKKSVSSVSGFSRFFL